MKRRGVLAFFLVCCACFLPVLGVAAEKDEAELKEKLKKLERENEELREKLAKAKQDTKKLYDEATRAEQAAGLQFRKPTAVVAQSTAATVPPVAQPAQRHGFVRFDKAEAEMMVTFGAARPVKTWRVHDATCEITKRNR